MGKRISFVVTGHIDHGKSTFVGRLLLDSGALATDKLENLKKNSEGGRLEYSYLTDALADEKSRGITIGVSQVVISYQNNEYVLIDAPGHHEFLQNMIVGASKADMAFLVIDAQSGVEKSTLRHMHMLAFLNVKSIIVVINKMDLVNYKQKEFEILSAHVKSSLDKLNLNAKAIIPISAYYGENIFNRSPKMPWYKDRIVSEIFDDNAAKEINDFMDLGTGIIVHDIFEKRIFGESIIGNLKAHNLMNVYPHGGKTEIELDRSEYQGKNLQCFKVEGLQTCLKRGDLLLNGKITDKTIVANSFNAAFIWFFEKSLTKELNFSIRLAKQESDANIESIDSVIDSSSLEYMDKDALVSKGCLIKGHIKLKNKMAFADFNVHPKLGRFVILLDGVIVGAGKIIQ